MRIQLTLSQHADQGTRFVKRNPMVSGVATLLSVLTDANLESFLSHSDVASFLGLHRAPLTLPTELNF